MFFPFLLRLPPLPPSLSCCTIDGDVNWRAGGGMCHPIHPRPYLRWRPRPRASPKPLEIAMCPFCKASWVKSGHGWVLGGRMAQPEFCIVKVNAHNKLAPIRSVGWRPSSSSSSSRSFCCRPLAFHPRRASSLRESRGGDGCALKSTTRLFYSCHRSEDGRTDGPFQQKYHFHRRRDYCGPHSHSCLPCSRLPTQRTALHVTRYRFEHQ